MIGVMIVPTGIGAEIGGHAGDANAVAKLMASVCDTLILHPNVVNASDINEMPGNSLYVEGSMLDRFLESDIQLKTVRKHNKILVATNGPLSSDVVNSVSAARATIGLDAEIVVLKHSLNMFANYDSDGTATGVANGVKELVEQVRGLDFDALAIATPITVEKTMADHYLKHGGVNPWGGIEARVSRLISESLNKPVAHAPVESGVLEKFTDIVDPRLAAEVVSISFLHCVLKGLHRAPRIGKGLSMEDVDFMVAPYGCFGRPHRACVAAGVPIIVVRENLTCLNHFAPNDWETIYVENYPEAAGVVAAMGAGVTLESVRRPLVPTKINGG